eukprot:5294302-Prymnesium_polylepis.1
MILPGKVKTMLRTTRRRSTAETGPEGSYREWNAVGGRHRHRFAAGLASATAAAAAASAAAATPATPTWTQVP